MNVALVHLPFWPPFMPPLGLAYISSVIKRRGHQVNIFDINVEAWAQSNETELWDQNKLHEAKIGHTFKAKHSLAINKYLKDLYKKICFEDYNAVGFSINEINQLTTIYFIKLLKVIRPNIKIFCGGPEVYFENKKLMELVRTGIIDVAIFGEAEEIVDDLFNCWEQSISYDAIIGTATKNTDFSQKRLLKRAAINFANLPLPDFSDFKMNLYRHHELPIMMSRGCVATCSFCTEFVVWKNYKIRTAVDVFTEIKTHVETYGIKSFYFCDSLINGNHEMLKELVDLINSSDIKISWSAFARVDKRLTQKMFLDLKKAGCHELRFGFESGSNHVLKLMNKNNDIETANLVIQYAHAAGVRVHGLFLIAFPGETAKDFFLTQKFIYQNRKYLMKASIGNTLGLDPVAPMTKRPKLYGIKTNNDGSIFYDVNGEWYSDDGSLDPAKRYFRLLRMQNFLDSIGVKWDPVPRTRLEVRSIIRKMDILFRVYIELVVFYFFYLRDTVKYTRDKLDQQSL